MSNVPKFEIIANLGCVPQSITAICRFEYKKHQINIMSTEFNTKISVFKGNKRNIEVGSGIDSVEKAIEFIDQVTYLQSLPSSVLRDLQEKVASLDISCAG